MIKYHALIKVAELGSISKAAAALGYSQPGISHVLNAFEEEMGFQLIVRSPSGISLTEAGEDVLKYCKEILACEKKINAIAASRDYLSSGVIRIGAFASALVSFIPKAIKIFSESYPNIGIQIEEYQAENMADDLKTGLLDIAFIASKPGFVELFDTPEGYLRENILEDRMCLLVNKDNPLARFDKVSYSHLEGCNLIVPGHTWDEILGMNIGGDFPTTHIRQIVKSDLAIFSMVSNDVGVAFVSNLESSIKFDNIVIKDIEENTMRTIDAYISTMNSSSASIKKFVSICKEVAAEMSR